MKPRPTSGVDHTAVSVVIVTMDAHLTGAIDRARRSLRARLPGLRLTVHAAAQWGTDTQALERCRADIAGADIVIATMLFMEEHFTPILDSLRARRAHCDAMVAVVSAPEVVRLTRLGRLDMERPASGPLAMLRRLRGGSDASRKPATGGASQMQMLRRLPRLLRFVPGTAQDLRAYLLVMQYWLAGSQDNAEHLVRFLVDRYADGPRRGLRGADDVPAPLEYPDVGIYHPQLPHRISTDAHALPRPEGSRGTVGLLLLRSYLLAGNTRHYDGVIAALQAQGLRVVPAFASGLDARPAIDRFFVRDGVPAVDAIVSLTGFSLVGGPAYNDAQAAQAVLERLDVPYLAAHPLEFQTLAQWADSPRGLLPVESTIMVAIPELDGATAPMVFGGRPGAGGQVCSGCDRACRFVDDQPESDMVACPERAQTLAARVARMVALRRTRRAQRRVAVVLFDFPPNSGATGSAAHLAVFESLHRTLAAMRAAGYAVEPPADVDALRAALLQGNASQHGMPANVHARIAADDHVRREPWLAEIEAQWGPAPGRSFTDGRSIFVLGARFGNVMVAIQPPLGYEGDPMRLLFERGHAPTHAFSAFYRWLREDFDAHAVLHFGTHGSLEFMPGKQTGLSGSCWSERLIGALPNLYLYASNNASEGAIAKRRSAATLVSYLTPPVTQAGLYRDLLELKSSLDRWRATPHDAPERPEIAELLQAQAGALELAAAEPRWPAQDADAMVARLAAQVAELEHTLIPHGLHVVGQPPSAAQRLDLLHAMTESATGGPLPGPVLQALVEQGEAAALRHAGGADAATRERIGELARIDALLARDSELPAILHALDGRYVSPAPGGDLLRTPQVLPTGRNLHGFDPFRIPSTFAMHDGARQAQRLLDRCRADGIALPESIAMVLWGTDNLKSEGAPIAQCLALMGAAPRFDGYGRIAGAVLLPLPALGRPRIDVVITLSGIFRDLLPLQTRLLAEAAWLAASADEPESMNFVRRHALAYQREHGCTLEAAALRVFGNAEGAYGANVNHLVNTGCWGDEDELAQTYARRKGFAYGRDGRAQQQPALLASVLADVGLAYQNLESVELGVTTIDHYFDTLGGIAGAVKRTRGDAPPVYIGDQTRGEGTVRTLREQVALETRTRALNPKWYEGMLAHGYEGVRHIEAQVTNTVGWSATTGQVQPWVYQQLAQTFVLDAQMRERLARLNPVASARVANRLLEASQRAYWRPDAAMLDALRRASDELEDRLEGVTEGASA